MTEIPEICKTAFDLTYHPVYRSSLFIHLIVSISSMFPLVYFIFLKLPKTSFHGNLKVLFAGYFISVLLFSIDFAAISIFEIVIPTVSKHPCDLLIPSTYLKIGNVTVSVFMTLSTFFPISITIERFLAMLTAMTYEKTPVKLGPILCFLNVLLDSFIIYQIYKNEMFDDGSISFVFFPKTLAPKMFAFFWVMFSLNFVNFIFNSYLLNENIKMKNSNSSLATKYQRIEIYQSTKLAVFVIFVHVVLFGLYVIGIMVLRYFGDRIIPNPTALMAFRGAFTTMISTYNLMVGAVAVYLNRKIKHRKNNQISTFIRMKSTGQIGAQNYENAIQSIWNSVSTSH